MVSTLPSRLLPWILRGACALGAVILFMLPCVAHAAGDPLGTAQTSVDGGIGLLTTYGPVLGSMYLLYQLASRLVATYASTSWFARGKRLAITTGVLGVAGATLQAQIAGSPWNVIALAAIAAAFKLLTPTVVPASKPTAPAEPTAPSASHPTVPLTGSLARAERLAAGGTLLLVIVMGCSVIGGNGCGPTSTAVLSTALDCTTPARHDLVDALTPTAVSAIRKIADPSGKITTEALRALFSGASLKNEAGVLAACVEARAVEFLASVLPTAQSGAFAPVPEGPHIDGASLRGALSAQFPGVVFKTSR